MLGPTSLIICFALAVSVSWKKKTILYSQNIWEALQRQHNYDYDNKKVAKDSLKSLAKIVLRIHEILERTRMQI